MIIERREGEESSLKVPAEAIDKFLDRAKYSKLIKKISFTGKINPASEIKPILVAAAIQFSGIPYIVVIDYTSNREGFSFFKPEASEVVGDQNLNRGLELYRDEKEDPLLAKKIRKYFGEIGLPYSALVFGEVDKLDDISITLLTAQGMSFRQTLEQLQIGTRQVEANQKNAQALGLLSRISPN